MIGATHRLIAVATLATLQAVAPWDGDVSIGAHPDRGRAVSLILLGGASVLGAGLPDLDLRFLPRHPWTGRLWQHRGWTHSLFALLLGAALLIFVGGLCGLPHAAEAFILGWGSHLIADACTCGGALLLWPWHRRIRLLPKRCCIRPGQERVVRLTLRVLIATLVVFALVL